MIRNFSNKNTVTCSDGTKLSRQQLERYINRAKAKKIELMVFVFGFLFCEECKVNEKAAGKLDCSHEVSVDECIKTGRAELAADIDNIKMRCRKCHNRHDKNEIQ